MPQRIQLRRTKGWRKPEGAIVVSRPSKWGNEFQVWENPRGHWHAETFDVERRLLVTTRVADRSEGRAVAANAYRLALPFGLWDMPNVDQIRAELRGHDLACWCPLSSACHADVLLEIANQETWEALMRRHDQRQADLKASNECAETLPHHNETGRCPRCGTQLTGRQRRWCSGQCQVEWRRQHDWGYARNAAKRRDGQQCVRQGCAIRVGLEVNHIVPRVGRGYGWGCHNHLTNLETLCHPHHLEVTAQQRAARQAAPQTEELFS